MIFQHFPILLCYIPAFLVVVHTFNSMAFLEVLSNDPDFHSFNPGFAYTILPGFKYG